jgi:hypothetical protein
MSDAIEQRVERFVREILALVERVSAERRAGALSAVAERLAETSRPPRTGASSTPTVTGPKGHTFDVLLVCIPLPGA